MYSIVYLPALYPLNYPNARYIETHTIHLSIWGFRCLDVKGAIACRCSESLRGSMPLRSWSHPAMHRGVFRVWASELPGR